MKNGKSKMEYANLSDCCEIIAGQSPPSTTYNRDGNGLPFFQGKADFGEIYPQVRFWCSSPVKIAREGDILISVRAPVGPTNINNVESCIGRGLSAIRPNGSVAQKYLLHYLRSIEKKLADKASGSTFSAITQKDLKNIQIPLPPLPVQQKIAAILDAADLHRQKTKTLIEKYDQLAQTIFQEMFGDFESNPFGFEQTTLGEYLSEKNSIKCGPFGSQLKIGEYIENGIPVYGIDNVAKNKFIEAKPKFITEEKYNDLKAFHVNKNDILITRTGTVGRTCLAPSLTKAVIGPNLLKIRIQRKGLSSVFLCFAFNYSESIKKQIEMFSPGATVAVYNTTNLNKLRILVPPLSLQDQFVNRIQLIEAQKERAQKAFEKGEQLFNTLLQRAFKGELVN
jgi:type I restriction enzyme, S subunit